MALGVAIGWWIGWAVGLVVVLLAAALLLLAIAQARRIARQADDISAAIDGARGNTAPLFDLARTNSVLDELGCGLGELRRREP